MFVLMMMQVPKIIVFKPRKVLLVFFKAFISVAVMVVVALYLKSMLNIFLVIIISGIVYFLFLFLFGGFKKEDIISVWNAFAKNQSKSV